MPAMYPVLDGQGNVIVDGAVLAAPSAGSELWRGPLLNAPVINTDILTGVVNGWVDVGNASAVSMMVVCGAGISAGALTFEMTNDPTNTAGVSTLWYEPSVLNGTVVSVGAVTIAANSRRMFVVPCTAKYIRARVSTAVVGGTVQAFVHEVDDFGPMPVSYITGSAGTLGVSGQAVHDAVVSGAPVRIAGRALSAAYTTVASGDVADLITTLQGVLVTRPFQIPELDWTYASAAGGIVNTTDVVLAAAAGAGLRRYVTALQIRNAHASVATEVVVKDGATVIYRDHFSANSPNVSIPLPTPLKTTANAALNVACITTGAAVYVNAQGYTAP